MFDSRNTRLSLAVRLALVVGAGLAGPSVFAQTAPPPDDPAGADQAAPESQDKATQMQGVVVTGSRIRQVDVETQQPVLTLDKNDIEKTGLTTVGDIISHMTIQGSPGLNKQSVLSSGPDQGGSYVDMRNLGADRVLVLVNGKRWVTGTSGMTDLSTIPSSVIERIEVLKDGASAVYGSDAVAGVVNIITRQHFDGAEARAYYGRNAKGDGQTQQYDFTLGTTGEKSSIVMGVSYNKQDELWDTKRALSRYPDGPRHPDSGLTPVAPYGKYFDGNGQGWALNRPGADATDPANYHRYPEDIRDSDMYNYNEQMMFRIPSEQKSMYVEGRYNFTDNLSFHSTAMYTHRVSTMQIAGYPLQTSSFRHSDGLISADSIYNPTGEDISFWRRGVEAPRVTKNSVRAMHLDAGLEGFFDVGEHSWSWDVGVNYNKGSGAEEGHGNINLAATQDAIGPSFVDAQGNPQCGTPDAPISGCVPWNILGGPAAMTPEVYDEVFLHSRASFGSTSKSYTANITGGLADLASGGELAFAAGVERREVEGYRYPDQFAQSGLSSDLASGPTSGGYDVNEAYAELSIPLLRDLPGARDLTFDLAGRYSRYSNFGSTFNAKYGFKWKPIDDLMFRGNYSQAFRAPTIGDLYGGSSETFDSFTDPCDARFGSGIYGSDVHAACVARMTRDGYPDARHFRQADQGGKQPITSANTQTGYPFTSGSSPDLQPETAVTRTLGVVYSPGYAPGLSLTLDWYRITIDNIIGGISANEVLENCYQGSEKYCNQFDRNADGQVVNLYRGLVNRGTQEVEGYDFDIVYRLPETAIGEFQVRSSSAYLSHWESQDSPDVPVHGSAGWYSVWRLRNNTSLDWRKGDFGATWTVRYFSSLREPCYMGTEAECNMADFADPYHGNYPARRVGAISFNDVSVRWDAPWDARVSLGVNNVFNRKPPIMYSESPVVNPAYDIDRYWFVSYNQKF